MQSRSIKQDHFLYTLLGLCLFYLGFEVFFNLHTILSVDEFWFAHRAYQYRDHLPYRDFPPYKTVLGYYFLMLPMLAAQGVMQTLIFTKQMIALVNTVILFTMGCWLTRFFSRSAVLTSLALLVTAEMVLSYSTNIRVDLFGYWFCFFAILWLLEKRVALAGLFMGLAFITTQKALWYIAASNGALIVCGLLFPTYRSLLRNLVRYNLVIGVVIIGYLLFWSWTASPQAVINSVFYDAKAMYQLDWYDSARTLFWQVITLHNPLLFLLWPLTLLSLCATYAKDTSREARTFIVVLSLLILLCLLPYKQVFPYYMQVTIPIFFTLYAAFFTWLYGLFSANTVPQLLVNRITLWLLISLYLVSVIFISTYLQWPNAYLLICLIPMLLGVYLDEAMVWREEFSSLFFNLLCIGFIFIGGIYPMMLFSLALVTNNGAYQKANVLAVNALLQDGSDYVAGIELIYDKTQPIPGMRHLMGPAIAFLNTPTPQLRAVMLPSLYEDPTVTTSSVIDTLKKSQVKFFVNNYRMMALPAAIREYLENEYEHYWGSIYLYAPVVNAHQKALEIKFTGNYLIESAVAQTIMLNHHAYIAGKQLHLMKGHYASANTSAYRLKLLPSSLPPLEARFQEDHWQQLLI